MKILVTGGAGYIGSVTNFYLKSQGIETVIFDNLSRGHKDACDGTELIVGDLANRDSISACFEKHKFDAVIHFAALALAGESMQSPDKYYANNVLGGINLLEAMIAHGCRNIVFSSTCAVYGFPEKLPVTEKESYKPVSVYGSSKLMFEQILAWYGKLKGIRNVNLRYFNACGATPDGKYGEAHEPETHIIPIALRAASGMQPEFQVYGNDYKTPDGTCIRDYIHVMDLASAHLAAVKYLLSGGEGVSVNLGVGHGYSNLEVLKAVEKVTGKTVKTVVKLRRPGDPDSIYADNSLARKVLGWNPEYTSLEDIIETAWKFFQNKK